MEQDILYFKSPGEALEFACEFLNCRTQKGDTLPAVITAIETVPAGFTRLSIPTGKGCVEISCIQSAQGPKKLNKGDFVAFHIDEELFPGSSPKSLVGTIVAKLKPEFDTQKGWAVFGE